MRAAPLPPNRTTSRPPASEDTSSEESDPGPELPAYLANFVSFADTLGVNLRATDNTSIRLTKINEAPVEGDIVLFNAEYGDTIAAGDRDLCRLHDRCV